MGYSRQEMETSIIWDDATKRATVYTCSPISMRKLTKLAEEFPDDYRLTWTEGTTGNITAMRFEVDARFIRFRKPATEAQREAAKVNAAKLHSASK